MVDLSMVSHGQGIMVCTLLEDIGRSCAQTPLRVILTLNLPEKLPFDPEGFPFPVMILQNPKPLGFGANHNQAFQRSASDFFGVLNPDLRFNLDPFPALLTHLKTNPRLGVIAPLVVNRNNEPEDNARKLPTPFSLICRYLGLKHLDYSIGQNLLTPDWVAGMFLLFPRNVFQTVGGFDERYYMYYEDFNLCIRLRLAGYEVGLEPRVSVLHEARRESHRNLTYLKWHLTSIMRMFASAAYLRYLLGRGRRD
jgi:N-acetylglucosaminyl-diphospho-decaprenol L-rhamnosyltransferase